MYGRFATYYDDLMSDYDYDGWSARVVAKLRETVPHAKTGLDLACGSGNFTVRLARAGYRMLGSDPSEEMLTVAAGKSDGLGIRYVCQSLNETALPGPVDFMTAMCDGVNYCIDGVDFRRLARSLTDGGVLIFDISGNHYVSETLGNNFYYEDADDVTYFWQNAYDETTKVATMELTFFCRDEDGRYDRFDETHRMRAYKIQELAAAAEPYFEVSVYGEDLRTAADDSSRRIHFVCKKK